MDEIDKFISEVSGELEENEYYRFRWDSFERMFDFEGIFGYYDEYGDYLMYSNSIDELLYKAFNINPTNCVRLIEYIYNKENLKFEFSEIKNFIKDSENEINLELPVLSSDDLKVFISYSAHDYEKAKIIYEMFDEAEIDCFLAGINLKGGVRWNPLILQNLLNSNVFILLLSSNFLNSFWCNQESSIAFLQQELNDAIFVPVSIDGTHSYGIFYDVQDINFNDFNSLKEFSELIDDDSISFENAIKKINAKKFKEVNDIIQDLRDSNSFHQSNELISKLKFKKISSQQIEDIIEIALVNDQVLYSFNVHSFLSRNISKFKDELNGENVEKLKRLWDS